MSSHTFFIIAGLISYLLIIGSFSYGLQRAKAVHQVDLKSVKHEVPNGYLVRTICSLVYYFCLVDWIFNLNLIGWSYFSFDSWIHWLGLGLLMLDVLIFWWIGFTLGANYHGPMHLHENHQLVTTGPYAVVRHPTYLAFPLLHLSLFFMTSNWLILLSGFTMAILVNHHRVKMEEKLLMERFGIQYSNYIKTTGKFFPKIFS
jgi:protein-S-isoprenylcysteine O-methyltransferase Ste14